MSVIIYYETFNQMHIIFVLIYNFFTRVSGDVI